MALVHLELQFVDESDNIQSCRFVQTMEQRLQRAFQDAERKVLNTTSKLNVQVKLLIFIKLLLRTTGEDSLQVLFLSYCYQYNWKGNINILYYYHL